MKRLFRKIEKNDYSSDIDSGNVSYFKEKEEEVKYDSRKDPDLDVLDSMLYRDYYGSSSSGKKKKKDKKKKKKDKDKKKKKSKIKKEKLLDLGDVFDDLDNVGEYRKKVEKTAEDFYEQRFNKPLILLRELMKQVNGEIVGGKTYLEYLKENNRQRGFQTAITAQTANISGLLGTKLQVIKEITSINKNISDLELKRMKEAGENNSEMNEEYIMNELYRKVVNDNDIIYEKGMVEESKKKKKKKKNDSDYDDEYGSDDDSIIKNLLSQQKDGDDEDKDNSKKKKKKKVEKEEDELLKSALSKTSKDFDDIYDDDYDEDDIDAALDEKINSLIEDGELDFSETEKYVKYEGKVKTIIIKDPENGRWRFAVVNKKGQEIKGHPVPTKRAVGSITYDKEKGTASDKLGNVYEVQYVNKKNKYDMFDD